MKYWVLDKNVLQKPLILDALFADSENRGVLFENTFVEMRAVTPDQNLRNSVSHLEGHSGRIAVAHHPDHLEVHTRTSGTLEPVTFIDQAATDRLPAFFVAVRDGVVFTDKGFQAVSANSESTLQRWSESADLVLDWLRTPENDAKMIQFGKGLFGTKATLSELLHPVSHLAYKWHGQMLKVRGQPILPTRQAVNTFSFRIILFQILVLAWWRKEAGKLTTKSHRLANDMTDATYCALATYLDGMVSCETMVNDLFPVGKEILEWLCTSGISSEGII